MSIEESQVKDFKGKKLDLAANYAFLQVVQIFHKVEAFTKQKNYLVTDA